MGGKSSSPKVVECKTNVDAAILLPHTSSLYNCIQCLKRVILTPEIKRMKAQKKVDPKWKAKLYELYKEPAWAHSNIITRRAYWIAKIDDLILCFAKQKEKAQEAQEVDEQTRLAELAELAQSEIRLERTRQIKRLLFLNPNEQVC
jgi:hypothetical protein